MYLSLDIDDLNWIYEVIPPWFAKLTKLFAFAVSTIFQLAGVPLIKDVRLIEAFKSLTNPVKIRGIPFIA